MLYYLISIQCKLYMYVSKVLGKIGPGRRELTHIDRLITLVSHGWINHDRIQI